MRPQLPGLATVLAARTLLAKSNLAKGVAGPTAVTLYMDDYGVGNEVVGHPPLAALSPLANVATGDVSVASGVTAANDLWVLPERQ